MKRLKLQKPMVGRMAINILMEYLIKLPKQIELMSKESLNLHIF